MIQFRHVTKRYGARTALADVSLPLVAGEVTLLLGANGAGKSTLLRCLLGITDFEGEIRVDGLDPMSDGPAVRARIGYMPQAGGLHPDLTVNDTMALYARIRRVRDGRGAMLIREAGLADHAGSRVGDLSGGMRQRLGFALALLTDPDILVLDEPSASLDASGREWLAERLRAVAQEGRTVLVSTHAGQELLRTGDRRLTLEDGRIAADERSEGVASGARVTRTGRQAPRGSVMPLAKKEVADAIGNRWLIAYAAALGLLGLAAAATGLQSSSGLALQAFGRTTATLMNLALLLAPLVAVLMAGSSIAVERERGTLEHLLALPLGRTELLLAKYAGLVASLAAATLAGFLPAGLLVAWHAGPQWLPYYLLFPAIALLAALAMAGVGLLVSVSSRSAVQAQGAGIMTWFVFVLLYDLLLMGSLAFIGLPVPLLVAGLVANPVDAARILGVLALEPDLYLLGPAGAYLVSLVSRSGAAILLILSLTLWGIIPVVAAAIRFRLPPRREWRAARRASASGDASQAGGRRRSADESVVAAEEVTYS